MAPNIGAFSFGKYFDICVDNCNTLCFNKFEKRQITMANVNVRIDESIKAGAEAVFSDLGLTPSTAINLFYKQVIRTHSIPFPLKAEIPNRKTIKALKEAEKMEKHPNKYKKYDSVEELMEELNH